MKTYVCTSISSKFGNALPVSDQARAAYRGYAIESPIQRQSDCASMRGLPTRLEWQEVKVKHGNSHRLNYTFLVVLALLRAPTFF